MNALSEGHLSKLQHKYGIDPSDSNIQDLIKTKRLRTIRSTEELQNLLGRSDVAGTGLYVGYPGNGVFTVRLDEPQRIEQKEVKYLRPSGQINKLYNPGVNLTEAREIWITEGELKALAGYTKGLPVVGLSGIWNWKTSGDELLQPGEKLSDRDALIVGLNINWTGKQIVLIYDSDIVPGHSGYEAYPRLAEQLYRLGATDVKIITLPSLSKEGEKTGLDDFLLAMGDQAQQELRKIIDRKEAYLPLRDGAETYAERLIKSDVIEDRLKGATAYLNAKREVQFNEWLKQHIPKAQDRKSYLRDAKLRLADIRKNAGKGAARHKDPEQHDSRYDLPRSMMTDRRYTIRDGCLCKLETKQVNKESVTVHKRLCNFVAYPTRQLIKDNGVETERFIEIAGMSHNGNRFKPAVVSMSSFGSMTWVATSWGARAALEPGFATKDELRHCIQSMVSSNTPEEVIYTHLGWRKVGDKWIYLHAGELESEIKVEPHKKLRQYILPKNTTNMQDAIKLSLGLLDIAPKSITIPLLSLVFLAALGESLKLAGIEPGFLMWLFGSTGSMKSTIAALFLCHFGQFNNKNLPCSFRDTPSSLESVTFGCKDSLLVIDDFYPSNSFREREKLENTAQQLTRAYGDRTGRARMNANLTAKESYPPRGMALATGEEVPLGQSTVARQVILEISPRSVNKKKLTEAQTNAGQLSVAMKGYTDWLAPQIEDLSRKLAEEFRQFRAKAQSEGRHSRLPEAIAHLYLGFNSFLTFAVSQEVLTEDEARKLAQEAWENLNFIVNRQSEATKELQPVNRFFVILRELQSQGKAYLADTKDESPKPEDAADVKRIGWREGDVVFLAMEVCYTAAVQYCKAQGEVFPVKKRTLISQIAQQDLIIQTQGGSASNVIKKTIAGKTHSVLPVSASLLEAE